MLTFLRLQLLDLFKFKVDDHLPFGQLWVRVTEYFVKLDCLSTNDSLSISTKSLLDFKFAGLAHSPLLCLLSTSLLTKIGNFIFSYSNIKKFPYWLKNAVVEPYLKHTSDGIFCLC